MKVSFFASLRQVVGQKTEEIPLVEGATVLQLVQEVVRLYPELEWEILNEHGNLYEHVHIVINGRDIRHLEGGINRVITPKDKVSMFPAIEGGWKLPK